MSEVALPAKMVTVRAVVQWFFFALILVIGVRFALFVHSLAKGGELSPFAFRSPGVEGFLPIGALTSLKYWLVSGQIHPVHPAALVFFLTFCLMSLFAKKSFCSWLCPVGTLSEAVHKLGRKLFGRNFRIWHWLDVALRGIKYLLLLFFVKVILFGMPQEALAAFLGSPYWAISDIKMLHFFTRMTITTMVVLGVLTVLSLFYVNFWCRYLCPYGALLGLCSMLSPFKIRRDTEGCTNCRRCTKVCPSLLPIHEKKVVRSPECTGCLTCVDACPEKDVLQMMLPFRHRPLPLLVYPAVVLLLYLAGIGSGMLSGHWHTVLTVADYQQLVPLVSYFGH